MATDDDMDMNYVSDVMRTMYNFSLNKQFTNFQIRAGEKTAHVHQSVICAKSKFFQAICRSGNSEALMKNASGEEEELLSTVVKFLYFGKSNITVQNVESLVLSADFINSAELKTQCEALMINKLTLTKLKIYAELAQKTDLPGLKAECLRFGKDHFPEVSHSEWYLGLSLDEVHGYLQDDELNAPQECEVLQAAIRWVKHSRATPAGKENFMERLFPCLRLPFCSRSQLEALRKDPKVGKTLKLGLVEYLLDGLHRDHKPRRFTEVPPPEASSSKAAAAKPPSTPTVKVKKTPARPTSAATPRAAIGKATAVAKPSFPAKHATSSSYATRSVERTEEHILIVGGFKAGIIVHKDIIGLNKHISDPITQVPTINPSLCTDVGDLLVSGGRDFNTNTSTALVMKFCFATRSWIALPDMSKPVTYHGSACLDKKLYTIGGCYWKKGERERLYNSMNVLNLTTMKWSACKPMSLAVDEPGIAVVDELLFVIAGHTGKEWSTEVNKYNTRMDKWEKCKRMPRSCNVQTSTVVVNREVYVFAGSLFQYNVDLDTWAELSRPMKPSRACSIVLHQGRLIVSGGYENKQEEPNDRVQAYDIAQKTWSIEKYTMPLALDYHWTVVVNLPTP